MILMIIFIHACTNMYVNTLVHVDKRVHIKISVRVTQICNNTFDVTDT